MARFLPLVATTLLSLTLACGGRLPPTLVPPAPPPPDPTATAAPSRGGRGGPAVFAAAAAAAPGPMTAHYIDVGQANATLLEFSCGAMLIDAGAQTDDEIKDLLGYLDTFFARRTDLNRTLESIVITHNHVDHTRALREVIEEFRVERLIENGQRGGMAAAIADLNWAQTNAAALKLTRLDVDDADIEKLPARTGLRNDTIDPINCPGGNPDIRIMSADIAENPDWPNDEFRNKNNHSVVVKVTYGSARFLFTGDLEEPAIETMVEHYEGTSALDVDVYQVGHHGSYNGTTLSLLEATTPAIAVISMGENTNHDQWTAWAYGHPRLAAVDLLRDAITRSRNQSKTVPVATAAKRFRNQAISDAIYGTGWDGNIQIRATTAGAFTVTLSKP